MAAQADSGVPLSTVSWIYPFDIYAVTSTDVNSYERIHSVTVDSGVKYFFYTDANGMFEQTVGAFTTLVSQKVNVDDVLSCTAYRCPQAPTWTVKNVYKCKDCVIFYLLHL